MEALNIGDTLVAKSDQLNADDLIGKDITVQITGVTRGDSDQPVVVKISGDWKPWKPCKTMRRVLAHAWGEDAAKWIGRWLVLYRDGSVTFGKEEVGGIRIRAMSHIPSRVSVSLSATKGKKAKHTVEIYTPPTPTGPMDEKVFGGWLTAGVKDHGWTREGIKALLTEHGSSDGSAAKLPPEKRREVAEIVKRPPPSSEEPPPDAGAESWE
jgi:hypothetical protein